MKLMSVMVCHFLCICRCSVVVSVGDFFNLSLSAIVAPLIEVTVNSSIYIDVSSSITSAGLAPCQSKDQQNGKNGAGGGYGGMGNQAHRTTS